MFKIVLVRHGESIWNADNIFTGWVDVDLTTRGKSEAGHAGILLKEAGFSFDLVYCSVLERTLKSVFYLLETLKQLWIPVEKRWELNERHYGALQGMNKTEAIQKFGTEKVFRWRRSYEERPPELSPALLKLQLQERRYRNLPADVRTSGESLKDTSERVLRFWDTEVIPKSRAGKSILIVAHGNSLRVILKRLHHYSDVEIESINVPTGVPLIYELAENGDMIQYYKLES